MRTAYRWTKKKVSMSKIKPGDLFSMSRDKYVTGKEVFRATSKPRPINIASNKGHFAVDATEVFTL